MTQQDFASSQSGSLSPGNPQVYLTYIPKPGLGWLSIKNFLLTVITLGIYSFWAKTNVRRHLWSCVRIMDEPLEYTGTGKELFLGMLVVLGIVILPILIIQNAIPFLFPGDLVLQFSVQFTVFVVILYLIGVAVYRARRYRLSRTIWRGIRGTLTGSPWAYAWKSFWMTLILPFTLLWSYPWMRVRLNSHIMNDTQFGSESFRFDGRAGPLYKRFAVLWVLMLVAMLVIGVLSAIPGLNIGSAVSDAETQINAENSRPRRPTWRALLSPAIRSVDGDFLGHLRFHRVELLRPVHRVRQLCFQHERHDVEPDRTGHRQFPDSGVHAGASRRPSCNNG